MQIGNFYVNPEMSESERSRYVESAETWLNAGELVASETNHDYAVYLLGKFLVSAAVFRPDEDSWVVPVQGPQDPNIIIIPIMPEDSQLTETTKALTVDKSHAARFTENNPGRIYYDAAMAMTEGWKGLVLLHETAHANNLVSETYATDHSEHWLEEVDVFEFEHELMQAMGGRKYEKLHKKLLGKFTSEFIQSEVIPGLYYKDYRAELERIFGKALSQDEERTRISTIYFDIVFSMFDELFGEDARAAKADFIQH